MKRALAFVAALVAAASVALAVMASPAHAIPPDRFIRDVHTAEVEVLDGQLTKLCGFEVWASTKGQFRVTAFFDKEGEVRGFQAHPSMATTYRSDWASIATADRGVDKVSFSDDGDVLVFGTGIHLKVKGQAYAIGLWRLTFDAETEALISEEYFGNFDLTEGEIVDCLCSALGDPALA